MEREHNELELMNKKSIDFAKTINLHINDCRKSISQATSYEQVSMANDYIKIFKALLVGFIDQQYAEDFKTIKDKYDKYMDSLNTKQKSDFNKLASANKIYAIDHFTILISLALRHGLVMSVGGEDGSGHE